MSVTTRGGQSPHWLTPFLGSLCDLSLSVLPSKAEAIKSYHYRLEQQLSNAGLKSTNQNQNMGNQILDDLTADVEELWIKADFPVIKTSYIKKSINALIGHKTLVNVRKHGQRHLNDIDYINSVKDTFSSLLDLSPCKCYNKVSLDQWQNVKCGCLAVNKIPDVEFYIDQRDLVRKFAIGARPSNKANKRRAELEEKDKKRQKKVEQSKTRLHNYEMEKSASNEQNYLDFDPSDEESVAEIPGSNFFDSDSGSETV